MKAIGQQRVDKAFAKEEARGVTVVRRSAKEWYFTFEADDPTTGTPTTYALLTQRGQLRTWADPRNLFDFLLERYGLRSGTFYLEEPQSYDDQNPQSR